MARAHDGHSAEWPRPRGRGARSVRTRVEQRRSHLARRGSRRRAPLARRTQAARSRGSLHPRRRQVQGPSRSCARATQRDVAAGLDVARPRPIALAFAIAAPFPGAVLARTSPVPPPPNERPFAAEAPDRHAERTNGRALNPSGFEEDYAPCQSRRHSRAPSHPSPRTSSGRRRCLQEILRQLD